MSADNNVSKTSDVIVIIIKEWKDDHTGTNNTNKTL